MVGFNLLSVADIVQEAVFWLALFFVPSYDPLPLDVLRGFLPTAGPPGDAEGNSPHWAKCGVGNCQGHTAVLVAVESGAGEDQNHHIAMQLSLVKHQGRTGTWDLRASLHAVFLAEAPCLAGDVVFRASHHLASFVDALIDAGNHVVFDSPGHFVFLASALPVVEYHVAPGPLCHWSFDAVTQPVVASLVALRAPVSPVEAEPVPVERRVPGLGEDTALVHLNRARLVPGPARLVQARSHEDTEVGEDEGDDDQDVEGGLYSASQLPWRI